MQVEELAMGAFKHIMRAAKNTAQYTYNDYHDDSKTDDVALLRDLKNIQNVPLFLQLALAELGNTFTN